MKKLSDLVKQVEKLINCIEQSPFAALWLVFMLYLLISQQAKLGL